MMLPTQTINVQKLQHQDVLKQFIARVRQIEEWIDSETDGAAIPFSARTRLASALLLGSQLHFKAIITLVERALFSPACSLLRVQWEGYVHALWALKCAHDQSVPGLWKGSVKFKDPAVAIQAIEQHEPYRTQRTLSSIHRDLRGAMHGFTHMGSHQVQRLMDEESIGQVFSLEEVADVLFVASRVALFSVMELATIRAEVAVAERTLEQIKQLRSGKPSCFHILIPAHLAGGRD